MLSCPLTCLMLVKWTAKSATNKLNKNVWTFFPTQSFVLPVLKSTAKLFLEEALWLLTTKLVARFKLCPNPAFKQTNTITSQHAAFVSWKRCQKVQTNSKKRLTSLTNYYKIQTRQKLKRKQTKEKLSMSSISMKFLFISTNQKKLKKKWIQN